MCPTRCSRLTMVGILLASIVGCQQMEKIDEESVQKAPEVVAQDGVMAQWAIGEPTKLPGDFLFTEGPTWTKDNTLVFSDIPANKVYSWDGKLMSVLLEPSGNANGITQDNAGNLLLCHHGTRQVTKMGADRKVDVLVKDWNGKKLNSPNDLTVSPSGTVFFTDPSYGLPRGEKPAYGEKNVFKIVDGKAVLVMKGVDMPNGLVFSPDGKKLYVADSGAGRIDVISMNGDSPSEPRLLCEVPGPDGIRVDVHGHIWAACADGVRIISEEGITLGTVKFPEQPANLCFGEDGKSLFVTARKGVYKIRVTVEGVMPGIKKSS